MSAGWCSVAAGAVLASGVLWASGRTPPRAIDIPLQPGLTLTYASSISGEPDYESLVVIEQVDSDAVRLRTSWNRGDRKWRVYRRPLSRRERERARSFYFWGKENDTLQYRGYAFSMATRVILDELKRTGRAEVAVLVPELTPRAPYRGSLTRVGSGAEPFPVLLDDQRVTVPGIHVKGVLNNMASSQPQLRMEFIFLDDADTPWYLDSRIEQMDGRGGRKLLVRIATRDVQKDLAESLNGCRAVSVHDIYFATASAEVDSASAPAFQRIADALAAQPEWRLTLVGHTDSIGTAAANLELSRRRAAAVRAILVREYGVASAQLRSDGRGEQEPLEDNATPAGRARNRRVDLKRDCD